MKRKEIECNTIVKIRSKNGEEPPTIYDSTELDESNIIVEIFIAEIECEVSKKLDPYPTRYGCDGMLYTDEDYAYYSRYVDTGGGGYYALFRFNRNQFMAAVKHACAFPTGLEGYISTLDGYEWIESESL